jgi:hypothetical protein
MTSFTIPNTFTPSTVISSSEMNANFTAIDTAFGISLGTDGAETLTGSLKAASGTAALPGITFGVDLDLGLFRKAANTLGFAAGGAEIGNWDASNLNLLAGLTLAGSLSLTASSPRINLTDSDTGADSRIDADNATGSLVYSADLNNEAGSSTHVWALDGTNEMVLTAAALTPAADDGLTLGTASLQWADLFLASGAVINFNNGNATLTHSADTLNFSVTNLQHGGVALATANDVQGANIQAFTASGTWTKPSGYDATCPVLIRAWGGGGSGSRTATGFPSGGGGGAYTEVWRQLSELGATETVTIGAGGAAQTTDSAGVDGGNTTFGSLVTAYGGGGGNGIGGANGGGGGGGIASAGTSAGAGGGLLGGVSAADAAGTDSLFGGGGGGDGATTASHAGGSSVYGGGGGGGGSGDSSTGANGGNSVYGGGGGGAGSDGGTGGSGGSSVHGGDGGGGGGGATPGTAGSQPGGGGGGSDAANSGAGGDGMVEVYVFPV